MCQECHMFIFPRCPCLFNFFCKFTFLFLFLFLSTLIFFQSFVDSLLSFVQKFIKFPSMLHVPTWWQLGDPVTPTFQLSTSSFPPPKTNFYIITLIVPPTMGLPPCCHKCAVTPFNHSNLVHVYS